MKVMVRRCNAA